MSTEVSPLFQTTAEGGSKPWRLSGSSNAARCFDPPDNASTGKSDRSSMKMARHRSNRRRFAANAS
jgi:hypothetical protein